jgi:CRP-like cAMP-binding protein
VLHVSPDGCTFGAVSVVLDVRCSATAIAKGNVTAYAIPKLQFKKMLTEFESTQSYWKKLAKLRKKKADNFVSTDDADEVDPEDAQTELFQLSMQLARAENGKLMETLKEEALKW